MRNSRGNYNVCLMIRKVLDRLKGRRSSENNPKIEEIKSKPEPENLFWCPFAKRVLPELPTKGNYRLKYPEGAVVHYTAGSYGLSELDLARERGYTYFLIGEFGEIYQGFPLNRWGQHAGDSYWESIGKHVSKYLVGIEVDCAGILTKSDDGVGLQTYWGKKIPTKDARVVSQENSNRRPGIYHKFTRGQERSLVKLLVWLKYNNPDVFDLDLVLGHDEVSPGRKTDPGGSLSITMPDFRDLLHRMYRDASSAPYNPLV